MSDGQNAESTINAPEVPPRTPAELGVWAVPPETAAMLRDIDATCGGILQKIGSLEVEYLASKYAAMDELKRKRGLFKNLVDEAAKKAGLDIDKQRWNLDTRTMTLVRAS